MVLQVGNEFPEVILKYIPYDSAQSEECGLPQVLDTKKDFAGKKVVIFGLPGAFTPTCSAQHLPLYVAKAEAIKAKGVDRIVCVSSNDYFVLDAWGKQNKVKDKITMASDANGELGRATGLSLDLSKMGMGSQRLTRFAAIVVDGKVTHLSVEPNPGE
ncbi:peroxiredoxin type-2, partial [Coemansia sp. S17]